MYHKNINIDLIYGVPDQTMAQWERTLDTVGRLRPDSVTVYQLRIKPGTPMSRISSARFPGEDICLEMGNLMLDKLESFGYRAWQPNQFVLRQESEHRYLKSKWEAPVEVVGVGVSAYSFVNNWMYVNYRTLPEYYATVRAGRLPIFLGKQLSRAQQIAKAVVLGIKILPDGINKRHFQARFGASVEDVCGDVIARLVEAGVVESTPEFLRLTRLGVLYADEVCVEFYAQEDKRALQRVGATRYGSYLDPV